MRTYQPCAAQAGTQTYITAARAHATLPHSPARPSIEHPDNARDRLGEIAGGRRSLDPSTRRRGKTERTTPPSRPSTVDGRHKQRDIEG